MNATAATARPTSFWVIAVAALLWNLLGLAMFYLQVNMSPEQLATMTPEQRQVYEGTPGWLNIAFGVAVVSGVLGAIGLLIKKKWAVALFLISLIAVVVQMAGAFAATPAWAVYGAAGLIMPVVVLVIALLLWRYSGKAAARGWLS
ncbi:hypothetical protein M2650_09055 [Luteimonas sp. SX5]|uniref:Sugar transporter n=1 Tax=Luteimonas galliterrae TaxID=2940486 RepID=A0ABT0MIS8_9GAMM|nr:hypothetical protein [Luteimonas galliterrae]MCL1634777.1 hypothetical protein [Luteimonas galliterrae]